MGDAPLTLDLNIRTGWAFWKPGLSKPRGGYREWPSAAGVAAMTNALEDWLIPHSQELGADEWIYENPFVALYNGHPNQATVEISFGFVSVLQHLARRHGIPCRHASRGAVLKHFIGRGTGLGETPVERRRYLKTAVRLVCTQKGWNVGTDEDLADALAMLDWVCHDTGLKTPWSCQPIPGPLFEGNPKPAAPVDEQAAVRLEMMQRSAVRTLVDPGEAK